MADDKNKDVEKKTQKEEKKKKKKIIIFSIRLKFALVMIFLTAIIVIAMAFYFIQDESKILKDGIIQNAQRELSSVQSSSVNALTFGDDLAMAQLSNNMKTVDSIRYLYFVGPDNIPLSVSFERIKNNEGKFEAAPLDADRIFDDEVTKKAAENENAEQILRQEIEDPDDSQGLIYDFSLPVYHLSQKDRKLATIRMGFSDENIRIRVAQAKQITIYIAIGFITFAFVISYILSTITTRPLKKLSQGVEIIGTGKLDHQIDVKSRDEIGQLARQFNEMTSELKDAKDKEIENRIMEEQLEVAKEIQEGLNPMGFYNKEGIQIKGHTKAAKGVGGDYFDYIDIDSNRVGALISDVSGKGIPASLVMVMIRTVFVSATHQSKKIQCAEVVTAINNSLSADFAIDKFATLFFMIYDRKKENLQFANAGHGPLFCYRKSKNKCTVTGIEGVPIGIMEDVDYDQTEVPFYKGDIIALYTDGVTEMRNEKKDEYGRTRLQHLLINNNEKNVDELVAMVVEDLEVFRGTTPPHDDTTILILKRTE